MARGIHVSGDNNGVYIDKTGAGDILDPVTTSYTICGWMKITGVATLAHGHCPLGIRHADDDNATWIRTDTANDPSPWTEGANMEDDGTSDHALGSISVATNDVRFYAITMTQGGGTGTLRFYSALDGASSITQHGTTTSGAQTHKCDILEFGNSGETVPNGSVIDITNMKMWTSVLDATQLLAEKNSEAPVITANLWGHWKMANAADLSDYSGNSRTLSTRASVTDGGMVVNDLVVASASCGISGNWKA